MGNKKKVTVNHMAVRITNRDGNVYDKKIIKEILDAYMDECCKALEKGERVHLSRIGTIIPEVKTHRSCYLPTCDNEVHEGLPYTSFFIRRSNKLGEKMNKTLINNIENGIYGLEELPFKKQQITILKNNGFIPEDAEYEEE